MIRTSHRLHCLFALLLLILTFPKQVRAQAASPTLTAIAPDHALPGTSITFTGSNFGAIQGDSFIEFVYGANQVAFITPTSWADTEIKGAIPAGVTSGYFVIVIRSGNNVAATSPQTFIVQQLPTLSSVTPDTGPVQTNIQVVGTGFGDTKGSISINGIPMSVSNWNDTTIAAQIPSSAASGTLALVTSDGLTASGLTLTVLPTPHITSISPSAAPVGTPITITGTNFGVQTTPIMFRGATGAPTSWNDTSITVAVPVGAMTGRVCVTANGVRGNCSPFGVGTPPTLTSVSPNAGAQGTTITLVGTGFGDSQGPSIVSLNRTPATITSWSDTNIIASVPAAASSGTAFVAVGTLRSNSLPFSVTNPSGQSATADIILRDSETGLGIVGGQIGGSAVTTAAPTTLQALGSSDQDATLHLAISPGQYAIEGTATGYAAIRTITTLSSGDNPQIVLNLTPTVHDSKLATAEASTTSSSHVLYGYAMDGATNTPISAASVTATASQASTTTDATGFYSLALAANSGVTTTDTYGETTMAESIVVSSPGYNSYTMNALPTDGGAVTHLTFRLTAGSGSPTVSSASREPNGDDHQVDADTVAPLSQGLLDWMNGATSNEDPGAPGGGSNSTIPSRLGSTVRVGTGCSLFTWTEGNKKHKRVVCTSSEVHSLEDYVAVGLAAEWRATWSADSLKAGAVAYRSYGAYYIQNPMGQNFDICNTDMCQVYDPSMARPEAKAAAIATAGVVLSSDGISAARAEYASETNAALCGDKSKGPQHKCCADAKTGDGTAKWPCMPDALGAGAGLVGSENVHGHGMSQRGSQRWGAGVNNANAKVTTPTPWQCILDHYYNDTGNSTGSQGEGGRKTFIMGPGGDGLLAYSTASGIYASGLGGTNPHLVTASGILPVWSPDQKYVAYDSSDGANIMISAADGSSTGTLAAGISLGTELAWSPLGSPIASTSGVLVTIDPISGSGIAAPGLNLWHWPTSGFSAPSFSPDGSTIAFAVLNPDLADGLTGYALAKTATNDTNGGTWLTPPAGAVVPDYNGHPSWAPDGKQIVFDGCHQCTDPYYPPQSKIYRMDANGGSPSALTGADFHYPQYSADGRFIFYASLNLQNGNQALYVMNADGSNPHLVQGVPTIGGYGGKAYAVSTCRPFDRY